MVLKSNDLSEASHLLNGLLADEVLLLVKTRNAHWNVEGPDFHEKHVFFEEQCEQLDKIIDDVAERIRSLGHCLGDYERVFTAYTSYRETQPKK